MPVVHRRTSPSWARSTVQIWGRGWRINPHGRGRAWDELERYVHDPEGYVDKVETELRLTA